MKNRLYIILALMAVAVAATSCSDFLDRQPYTTKTSENFYKTDKEIDLATTGLYGTLQSLYRSNYIQFAETPSDDVKDGSGSPETVMFDQFTVNPLNGMIENGWIYSYHSILQSNIILANIDGVAFDDDSLKMALTGEALFVRGLNYFNLARFYGKVPIVTRVLTQEESRRAVRDDEEKVYEQVISDLRRAADMLPEKWGTNRFSKKSDIGRATKYAALALLGKVYLTLGEFDEALNPLDSVIRFGGYELLTDFAKIFDPNNANHAESIFEIQFDGGNFGEGSMWSFQAHNRNLAEAMGISCTALALPENEAIWAFDSDGGRTNPRFLATVSQMERVLDGKPTGAKIWHINKHYMDHTLQNQSDDNWPLLRLADVYLMYAEAHTMATQSVDPADVELVNKLRRRAWGYDINAPHATRDLAADKTSDWQTFRQAILDERRLELMFEGHRWFDLVRTGQYVEVMNIHRPAYNVRSFHRLFPVPQRELDINPNLRPNNEGY